MASRSTNTLVNAAPAVADDFTAWADELTAAAPPTAILRTRVPERPEVGRLEARLVSRSAILAAVACVALGLLLTGGARIAGLLPSLGDRTRPEPVTVDAGVTDDEPIEVSPAADLVPGSTSGEPSSDPGVLAPANRDDVLLVTPVSPTTPLRPTGPLDDLRRTTTGLTDDVVKTVKDLVGPIGATTTKVLEDVRSGAGASVTTTIDDVLRLVDDERAAVTGIVGTVSGTLDSVTTTIDEVTGGILPIAPIVAPITGTVTEVVPGVVAGVVEPVVATIAPTLAPVLTPLDDAAGTILPAPKLPKLGGLFG